MATRGALGFVMVSVLGVWVRGEGCALRIGRKGEWGEREER